MGAVSFFSKLGCSSFKVLVGSDSVFSVGCSLVSIFLGSDSDFSEILDTEGLFSVVGTSVSTLVVGVVVVEVWAFVVRGRVEVISVVSSCVEKSVTFCVVDSCVERAFVTPVAFVASASVVRKILTCSCLLSLSANAALLSQTYCCITKLLSTQHTFNGKYHRYREEHFHFSFLTHLNIDTEFLIDSNIITTEIQCQTNSPTEQNLRGEGWEAVIQRYTFFCDAGSGNPDHIVDPGINHAQNDRLMICICLKILSKDTVHLLHGISQVLLKRPFSG